MVKLFFWKDVRFIVLASSETQDLVGKKVSKLYSLGLHIRLPLFF